MIEVESPCIGTCTLNCESVCVGCGRRLDEIAEWPRAFDPRKRRIVELSLARLAAMQASDPRSPTP